MVVHSFWIFDRHTHCIFHREYNHLAAYKAPNSQDQLYPGRINTLNDSNESKLLYGMLHSLRSITNELTTDKEKEDDKEEIDVDFNNSLQLNNNNKVYMVNTLNYKLQILETVSGLKMVALTDTGHRNLQSQLRSVYTGVYVPLVVDNGMAAVEFGIAGEGETEVLCPLLRGDTSTIGHVQRRESRFVRQVDKILL
ncbi:TRAPP subunit bet5 [Pichia californica]|uniref:Trafficking protein particle complex subunit n=1 Tax=Pichia californica TaxID=460514 RepID=A0A9P7BFX8_9ASCO|nr:TRAPP subunit bet5 [[Candida] californica]